MDMAGERRIDAPREVVWQALNDPSVLQKCIPGCQELEKTSESEMTAAAVLKVGPVSARFKGNVTLSDLDPPNGYRITGEGQGGVAGFAKGTADVRLEPDGDATILRYTVSAQIGGKLSQLGGRLIDSTARKMSDAFFKRFAEEIAAGKAEAETVAEVPRSSSPGSAEPQPKDTRDEIETPPPPRGGFGVPVQAQPNWASWLALAASVMALLVTSAWTVMSVGSRGPASSVAASTADVFILVQMVVVLAVGYLLGLQHGAVNDRATERQMLLALLMERRNSPGA
jgi:carbon monoxide dehydrogenase subunit G